jgi:hypothetical protein
MKHYLKTYSMVLITFLFFTFVSSLILTILDKSSLLNISVINIIANTISYILLAILSYVLGIKLKKHGLYNGILFSLLILSLTMVVGNDLSMITTIIKVVTKSIIIIFFTILGVNKKNS